MARFKRSSRFRILTTILAVAVTLCLVFNLPAQVQAQLQPSSLSNRLPSQWGFRPPRGPNSGGPVNTISGGTRGDGCRLGELPPVSLVPISVEGQTAVSRIIQSGTTMAEYPTFYWYMPPTSASAAEFVLWDANREDVYRAQYTLAKSSDSPVGKAGIMSFSLPAFANLPPLNIGEKYHWSLTLICDAVDRSGDVYTEGDIERVQPDPTLAGRIQQATPEERVALFANARLWYETVEALDELRRVRPNNPELAEAWSKLLSSAGLLDLIAQK